MLRTGRIPFLQHPHWHLQSLRVFTRSYGRKREEVSPLQPTTGHDSGSKKQKRKEARPQRTTSGHDSEGKKPKRKRASSQRTTSSHASEGRKQKPREVSSLQTTPGHDSEGKKPKLGRPPGHNKPIKNRSSVISWLSDKSTGDLGHTSRVNIVSAELCNDVIARLASSLRRHVNCDIIDLNSGVGLWSAALHDHIKPRSHLLVEEDEARYLPFIRPLLEKPGSRYRHVPWPGMEVAIFDRLIEGGFLANHQRFEPGDPRRDLPNDSLLLVANVSQHHQVKYRGVRLSILLMYQLLQAAQLYSALQAYGRVRMLIWSSDNNRRALLPRSVIARRKFALEAEFALENAFEVAGLDEYAVQVRSLRRDRDLDLSRSVEVTRGMLQRGVATPPERKGELQKEAEAIIEGRAEKRAASFEGVRREWHVELEALEQGYREGSFTQYKATTASGEQPRRKSGVYRERTPEFARLRSLRIVARRRERLRRSVLEHADEPRGPDDVGTDARSGDAVLPQRSLMSESPSFMTEIYRDEKLAAQSEPPLLLWDRRMDEPLIVQPSEFYPEQSLALLDLHPKPGSPVVSQSSGSFEVFEYILNRLFITPSQTVARAIESLAPGALEALTPRVPALRDPAKGGNPDLNQMRVRTMTAEMIEGLVQAWQAWPLRLSRRDLLLSLGDSPG